MRPDQWDRVQELLDRAAQLPPERRSSLLNRECADDSDVRREVESLLAFPEDDFLDHGHLLAMLADEAAAAHPTEVDGYRILEVLGKGGMGVVYRAAQEQPVQRTVALKLIKLGMDTQQVVERFGAERQALALMNHPNIARVYDAGASDDGRPYFVMELVDGRPITRFCDEERWTLDRRLELFLQVCRGVEHAHQKGVIHRDLKPGNVLVSADAGFPEAKIIDFGIAKATDAAAALRTGLTQMGQVVGTVAYMSPEQAHLTTANVDTRTDVYSLGVLLYELLVGAVPLDATDPALPIDEAYRRVREVDPPRPSTRFAALGERAAACARDRRSDPSAIVKSLRGDPDWIVMKALEKDPARRYATVSELASDIHHLLRHEPVSAGPPGQAYRLRKFVRRHRVGVGFAAILALALSGGFAGTAVALVRAQRAEREATAVAKYLVNVFRRPKAGKTEAASITALEILDAKAAEIRGDLAGEPGLRGRFMAAMAEAYTNLGSREKARALLTDALPLLRQAYGNRHREVFNALNESGNLANAEKDYVLAERYFAEALPMAERLLRRDHRNVATILKNLGDACIELQRYDDAERYLERSLRIRQQEFGPRSPRSAPTLASLARLYTLTNDHDRAAGVAEQSLAIRLESFDKNDLRVAFGYYMLAEAQRAAGRYPEAVAHFEKARGIYARANGEDSSNVGECEFDLAKTLSAQGRPDEAYTHYLRARAIQERAHDTAQPKSAAALARILEEYAAFLETLGRPDEAGLTRARAAQLG